MSIETRGLDEATELLGDVAGNLEHLDPALEETATTLLAFVAERFATRTAPDGTAWAPLKGKSESTGATQASVFAIPSGTLVTFGADSDAAGAQNFGTSRVPARKFLPDGTASTGPEVEMLDERAEALATFVAGEE